MAHEELIALIEDLRQSHYINDEDCWYSCPKAKNDYSDGSACCSDAPKDTCTCGADANNAKVDALLAVFSDPASIHLNILRGMIPLNRMNALHIAGATDYDTLKAENARLRDVLADICTKWGAIQKLQDEEPGHSEPDNWRCWRKELNGKTSMFDGLIASLVLPQQHGIPYVDVVISDMFTEWAAEDGSQLDAMALPVESEGGELD